MKSKFQFASVVISLIGIAPICHAAEAAGQDLLAKAATSAEGIQDHQAWMIAWWRVAGVAALMGDETLCSRAIANGQRDVPAGNAQGPMLLKAFALRFNVLAKISAGKVNEAEALIPPPPARRGEDMSRDGAQMAFVQGLARIGDVARALKEAAAMPRMGSLPYGLIAQEQAEHGDKAGAVATSKLIVQANTNAEQCQDVAVKLVKYANADDEARTVACLYEPYQDVALAATAKAQAEAGRIDEAEKTVAFIKEEFRKYKAKQAIAAALVKSGKVDQGEQVAASMNIPGDRPTNVALVRAAMASGNWDAAARVARDLSPPGDRGLSQLVDQTKAKGRLDALSQSEGAAEDQRRGWGSFVRFTDVGIALATAKNEHELQRWVDTLKEPSDKAAVYLGAAMGAAGIHTEDMVGPDAMIVLK